MSQDDSGYPNGRRRPPPPPRDPKQRARFEEEESFRKRQQQFEREEGPADELRQMGLKLLRRVFAEQAHVRHAVSDYGADLQRRMLLRALDGDEARYRMVVERMERSRALSQEHMRKAAALQMDYLASLLDVQRGWVDALLDRMRNRAESDHRSARFVERLVGLGDDDIQHATIKSVVLYEMVKDMLKGQDPYFEKLTEEERQHLLEFALGMRSAPPDFMATLFKDVDVRRPRGVPKRTPAQGNQIVEPRFELRAHEEQFQKRLGAGAEVIPCFLVTDQGMPAPGTPDAFEGEFSFDDDSLEDREVTYFIGPCVAEPPIGWPEREPWPDTRFNDPVVSVTLADERWEHAALVPQEASDDAPPRLRALETVRGTVKLSLESEVFFTHAMSLLQPSGSSAADGWLRQRGWLRADGSKGAGDFKPVALRYRVSISFPGLRRAVWVRFAVIWDQPPTERGDGVASAP